MIDKVAIPILNNDVAPCFEVARKFLIVKIRDNIKISETKIECLGCNGYSQVKFLVNNKINILICNGIKLFYRDLLKVSGLKVISNVTESAENAVSAFISGRLIADNGASEYIELSSKIPHDDLVCWTREFFLNQGFKVSPKSSSSQLLIDLVAEISCPNCNENIKVGICCGGHTYRISHELRDLRLVAPDEFHAKVFVYPFNPRIHKACTEYDIQLIDPDWDDDHSKKSDVNNIPILRYPIIGHEKACANHNNIDSVNNVNTEF